MDVYDEVDRRENDSKLLFVQKYVESTFSCASALVVKLVSYKCDDYM